MLGVVVVKKKIADIIVRGDKNIKQQIKPTAINQLRLANIITSWDDNASDDLKKAKNFFQRKILGVLCLMLTESCNLKCHYCFIEHKFPANHIFHSLTPRMAKIGIDVFVKHLPESIENGLEDPTISFYGGEPLLLPYP
jgi:sulfatase maturation enzyme AslB (radical SAM superfamily)